MATALSQLEDAHRAVGGTGSGRRTNTLQLNYAFVLLLSAYFQAFCRDLHSETATSVRDALSSEVGVTLLACRSRRNALDGLARSFDRAVADRLQRLLDTRSG